MQHDLPCLLHVSTASKDGALAQSGYDSGGSSVDYPMILTQKLFVKSHQLEDHDNLTFSIGPTQTRLDVAGHLSHAHTALVY